jgi:fatty acid desaturase
MMRFALRMLEQGVIWMLGCALVLLHLCAPLGIALIAIVYARNLEFVHECLHGLALPRGRANAVCGELLAAPMLVSFTRWRREHMQHHRDVRIEGFRYEYERLTTLREYVVHSLMLRHFAQSAGAIARLDPRYRTITIFIAGVGLACAALHSSIPLELWLVPLPLAAIVHTHIELPEHFGLTDGTDPLRNSRVITANAFVTWFVNGNNYHAIHHWKPNLPIPKLAAAFAALPAGTATTTSYGAFFADFYRRLVRGGTT